MYGSGYCCAYGLKKEQQEGLEIRVIFFLFLVIKNFIYGYMKKSQNF